MNIRDGYIKFVVTDQRGATTYTLMDHQTPGMAVLIRQNPNDAPALTDGELVVPFPAAMLVRFAVEYVKAKMGGLLGMLLNP